MYRHREVSVCDLFGEREQFSLQSLEVKQVEQRNELADVELERWGLHSFPHPFLYVDAESLMFTRSWCCPRRHLRRQVTSDKNTM